MSTECQVCAAVLERVRRVQLQACAPELRLDRAQIYADALNDVYRLVVDHDQLR
jgi:hypothetical protein